MCVGWAAWPATGRIAAHQPMYHAARAESLLHRRERHGDEVCQFERHLGELNRRPIALLSKLGDTLPGARAMC